MYIFPTIRQHILLLILLFLLTEFSSYLLFVLITIEWNFGIVSNSVVTRCGGLHMWLCTRLLPKDESKTCRLEVVSIYSGCSSLNSAKMPHGMGIPPFFRETYVFITWKHFQINWSFNWSLSSIQTFTPFILVSILISLFYVSLEKFLADFWYLARYYTCIIKQ